MSITQKSPQSMWYDSAMTNLPPMERLVRKIEAIRNGESKETEEQLREEHGDWWMKEALEWVELSE